MHKDQNEINTCILTFTSYNYAITMDCLSELTAVATFHSKIQVYSRMRMLLKVYVHSAAHYMCIIDHKLRNCMLDCRLLWLITG